MADSPPLPPADDDAVTLVSRRLRDREPGADDEWVAREILAALRGLGWRPTTARPGVDWHRASGSARGSLDPDVKAALFADLEAQTEAFRATGPQAAVPEGDAKAPENPGFPNGQP